MEFEGRTLTWAGSSPFTGAVVSSPGARELVLQITRLPTGGPFPACTGVRWRPLVVESRTSVTVTLSGYAPADESGQCIDGLDAPVPFPVTLSAPVGARRLVDGSDGTTHPVFDGRSMPVPSSTALPAGVRGEPVRWDEKTRVASKRWQSAGPSSGSTRDVRISFGPAAGIAAGAPLPSRTGSDVRVGDVDGRLWHGGGPYDVVVVRFPRGTDVVEVRTVQDDGEPDTEDQALRIARSLG